MTDASELKSLKRLKKLQVSTCHVVFSPDGKTFAAADNHKENTLEIWDLKTYSCQVVMSGHTDCVMAIMYSIDGTRIYSASWDKTIRVWDVATGRCEQVASCIGDEAGYDAPFDYVFSADAKYLTCVTIDTNVFMIWDWKNQQEFMFELTASVSHVLFSPDSKYVAATSYDNAIRVYKLENHKQVYKLDNFGHRIAFSPDGQCISAIKTSQESAICIWKFQSADGHALTVFPHTFESFYDVFFTSNGQRVVASCEDGLHIWNVQTGQRVHKFRGCHVNDFAISSKTDYIAIMPYEPHEATYIGRLTDTRQHCNIGLALLQRGVAPYVALDIIDLMTASADSMSYHGQSAFYHFEKIKMIEQIQKLLGAKQAQRANVASNKKN